ncbi:DUF2610 domain-containing protein [Rickettsiales bacterium]|nr:DUF2610 domain-containing protein [Rickettsiales bacterium]MDB2550313.1 DUF2610 domain-containing protein [Rickettsiales bacterium]
MVRKITVNCNFNGVMQKVPFYVGSPSSDSHPLGFQAKWLSTNSGGEIPDEFMKSIENIKNIADKNKVPFEDLLAHVMDDIEAKKLTSDKENNSND